MPHPGRNNIYEATIRRMVGEALETREREFAASRGADSDEQLLGYLRFCADILGHTPWPREIVGGSLIEARFGSWENAVGQAKLPMPTTPDKITAFARYQEEEERQKVIYRQKKAAKKQKAQMRLKSQKEKRSVSSPSHG